MRARGRRALIAYFGRCIRIHRSSSSARLIDTMVQKYSTYGDPYTLLAAAATQFA